MDTYIAELTLLPVKMMAVYATLYLLLPRMFMRGKTMAFGFSLLILVVLVGVCQWQILFHWTLPQRYPAEDLEFFQQWDSKRILQNALTAIYVIIIATLIKVTRYWFEDQQKARAMEKGKLEAELKFLKSQIHPHFLFNTLNNLYALTLKQSEMAPQVVLRLSGLIHYMLYDTGTETVPLSKEIESLHNYIALEKIRYGRELDISFDVTGDTYTAQIAPLLLLPFIENSFKHGVSDEVKEKWITINLNVNHEHLVLKVENSRSRLPKPELEYTGGIGLKNVRRRLQLLYPEAHELKVVDDADTWLIVLKLSLRR
ncbi:histidine kinase [Pontibacter sp. G13]|uniref:sensor histidine kinase n=1 Tax=Pontibacter sp. G13 TaxID=3074898 RepID=UPI00288B89E4|nr:histidine kinase [Pontibacter sp. G13]WNJ18513.1 histidine kinase [Pontibacter sp. G13]